jgi:hypothetical protein
MSSSCTTSRGLGPVSDFFVKGGAKDYPVMIENRLESESISNSDADSLKMELDETLKLIEALRIKQYNILQTIIGKNFEADLIPIDDFLNNKNGVFPYKEWILENQENGKLSEAQTARRIRELDVIQELVDALMTGDK